MAWSRPECTSESSSSSTSSCVKAGDTAPAPLVDHIAAAAKDLHIDRAVLDEIVNLLEDKSQVVLYGPPGTEKTFLALRLASAIAEGKKERISLVQFHPAMSYGFL